VSGRNRKLNTFAIVLAMSRHMFVRPVLSMDQTERSGAHVAHQNLADASPNVRSKVGALLDIKVKITGQAPSAPAATAQATFPPKGSTGGRRAAA
jgi:hypothetical protein